MKYSELIDNLIKAVPEIKDDYNNYLNWFNEDIINAHNIFKDVLCPYLIEELSIMNKKGILYRIFEFIEHMALSTDYKVKEVLFFTILKELGEDGTVLNNSYYFMGEETKKIYYDSKSFI